MIKYLNAINERHHSSQERKARTQGFISDYMGLHQGCALRPMLFNVIIISALPITS